MPKPILVFEPIKITPTCLKALNILFLHDIQQPSTFGEMLWGRDHPGYNRVSRCGPSGSRRGGGMDMAAGGYLGKLRKQGLISIHYEYRNHVRHFRLTDAGKKVLLEHKIKEGSAEKP